MINLKRIDFYGQLILIITFALFTVLLSFDYAFIGYFIVGGWQILSALIHFFAKNNLLRNSLRKAYEVSLTVIIIIGIVMAVASFIGIYYLWFLLWATPLIAIWYCYITLSELKIWEARALIHLK